MVISEQFLSCVKKIFRVYLVTERDHQRYNLQPSQDSRDIKRGVFIWESI